MTPQDSVDLHADFVRNLIQVNDWPALLRYWMAHQYEPALQQAVSVVQLRGDAHPGEAALVNYLACFAQDPLNPSLDFCEEQFRDCPPSELYTLYLCYLFPRLALYESVNECPVELQQQLFQIGLQATEKGKQLAVMLQDAALLAFLDTVQAAGWAKIQELENAKRSYLEALAILGHLEQTRPGAYQSALASTLNNLGNVQRGLEELEDAKRSYQEAEAFYLRLDQAQPGAFQADIARTLLNLGNVQRDLQELEDAKHSFQPMRSLSSPGENKTSQEPQDLHAAYVRDLAIAGDWPALVRYWMAHEYKAALLQATSLVQLLGQAHPSGAALVDFLTKFTQNPLDFSLNFSNEQFQDCPPSEFYTLYLCYLFPRLLLCERADQFPVEQQQQLFQIGLQAIEEGKRLANMLQDEALVAFLAGVQASGLSEIQELEEAKRSYQEAKANYRHLEQARPGVYLVDLATTLNNLGIVQRDLQELENAKSSYQEALAIRRHLEQARPGVYLAVLASTLNNLGNVQRDLQELEDAKRSCQEALAIRRRLEQARPGIYLAVLASTLNNLGNVQRDLQELEDAKSSYQEAEANYRRLEQARPGVYLADVAMTLNNLGNVQSDLQELEDAKRSHQEALAIRRHLEQARPGVYLADVAMTISNLANVQRDLRELEDAKRSCQEALAIQRHLEQARPGVYLAVLATTLNNLGVVQSDLQELEEAKRSYQEAETNYRRLEQARPGVYLADVAITLNNLGGVRHALRELEDAKRSYQEALAIRRRLEQALPEVYLSGIAMTLNNLGTVQWGLQELEDAQRSYQEAEACYRMTASRFPTAHLPERLGLWSNLGRLYLTENETLAWPDRHAAQEAFRVARDCAVQIRGLFHDPELRKRSQTQHIGVYDTLVEVCVDLWEVERDLAALREAVEVAEQGRSRHLLEMLADETLSPTNTPLEMVTEFRQLRKQLRQAQMRLQHEESRPRTPPPPPPPKPATEDDGGPGTKMPDLVNAADRIVRDDERLAFVRGHVAELTQRHQELLVQIQQHDREFNPDEPVARIDLPTIRRLLPTDKRTAALQFTLTDKHGIAILITHDDLYAIQLPELRLRQMLDLLVEWLTAYYDKQHDWSPTIPRLLARLAAWALHPLESALQDRRIERLLIAPHRALHLFPLHACKQSNGRYLLDDYEVVYTPSLSILHRCSSRERPHREQLLLVENPTGDLPFTEVEGAQLRELYRSPPPLHHYAYAAGKDRLLAEAERAHVLNYTGHAVFNLAKPLESALVMGHLQDRSQWLTLRDIFCGLHLPGNRLTVINGCESGLTRGDDQADELIGLPTGFLYAGATAVVSTLWSVYDISSALLVSAFHRNWLAGQEIGAALRAAQLWLRDGIPSGVYLRDVLLPPLLKTLDDVTLSKKCREQAEYYARTSPHSPPFAGEVHWAAFFASGLTYPLKKQNGN